MQLSSNWNSGGGALVEGAEKPSLRSLLNPAMGITLAELKAQLDRQADQVARVVDTNRPDEAYAFRSSSVLAGDDILVVAPTSGSGRWVRKPGTALLRLPFTFATANNAPLLVVPAGCRFLLHELWWGVDVSFTGGTTPALGVHSTKTGYTTAGDLLGGASGDLTATLVAGAAPIFGTIGANFETVAERRVAVFNPADEIRLGRIASAFTAGSGSVNLLVTILQNAGA